MRRQVSLARIAESIRALLLDAYQTFFAIFFGLGLEYMFERSLKLSLHIPKRFNAFKVLNWFSVLLEVTCVIFERATNTDV